MYYNRQNNDLCQSNFPYTQHLWTRDHSMDHHYGELPFLHTFPQNIASIVHKFTPSIISNLASEIILINSERKYNTSESGAIYLSVLQNNHELINFKKSRKFNFLNIFNRKEINHYLTKEAHQNLRIHICCFPLTVLSKNLNGVHQLCKKQNLIKQIKQQ